jgi:class 3 adenylate cyclase/tetratricopeptide (TPR) repeat protein
LAGRTEERRFVTVVFADLVGFTTLSERRDPEQVKHLVDRCFGWLAGDIVSFGGRVDKVVGDALVALFGAPTAHEDDAERAVRAALSMQATLRRRANELDHAVEMRIGVNSGEVLVGEMQAAGDYTAMGDVVNTASRLQTAADPGEVLVGVNTFLATERVIRYRPRGLLVAKGREEPVDAYTAVEPAVAPGSRARSRVPMVGREAELELLRHAAGNALGHGRAAMLLIAGDAGMGKTRLADEVARWAANEFGTLSLEGRCLPYGEANVWWPVAEALRQAGKVRLGVPLQEAMASITALVAHDLDTKADAPEVQRIAQGLVQVLGYDEARHDPNPSRDREAVEAAVVALLEASSSHNPVVLQLSDLHWADTVVLHLIATVFERMPRHPIVLIATTRRSLLERWTPPSGRHDSVVLNLDALDQDASSALLDSLIAGGTTLDSSERQRLIDRAGGNPFFLEELVALSAADAEVEAELPGTLRGLLTARLDRLDAEARALIDDAAFIGRRGPIDALDKMALHSRGVADIRATLEQLAEADLLVLDGDSWSFRSDLLREVAYSTLTKHDRARRHEEIARWLEGHLDPDIPDSVVDQLANHWSTAAELGEELGTRSTRRGDPAVPALHWLEEAAERAERMRALGVAERLYDRALRIADLVSGDELKPARRVQLLVGRARSRAEERDLVGAQADVDKALALALANGVMAGEAGALLVAGDIANKAGRIDDAVSSLRRAAERYEQAGDLAGMGEALRVRALAEMFAGRFDDAARSGLAALDVFETIDDPRRKAWTLQNLAWVAFQAERTDEAERYLHDSMAMFQDLNDRGGLHWTEGLYAFVCLQRGNFAEAEELQARVLQASRTSGDRWAVAMMLLLGALLHLWSGRTAAAVDEAREALSIFEAMEDRFGRGRASWTLGRSLMMVGEADEGVALLEAALAVVRTMQGGEADAQFASAVLVSALVHLGEPQRALAAAGIDDRGLADPSSVDFSAFAPVTGGELAVGAALAALQLGEPAAARTWLGDVSEEPYPRSVLALLLACEGDAPGTASVVAQVAAMKSATYLDGLFTGLAAGLVAAAGGDVTAAKSAFASLRDSLDATDDQLSRAVALLGEARALRLLGDPAAEARETDASVALRRHGAVGPGWAALFESIGC